MKTKTITKTIALAVFSIFLGNLSAQVPQLLNYQGRVAVDDVNFDGSGQFKFALVNTGENETATAHPVVGGLGDGQGPTRVIAIDVTHGGSGYIEAPAVTIDDVTGSGAAATAIVEGGVVTSITVTNNGSNYHSSTTTVTIDPPPLESSHWSNDGSSAAGSEPTATVGLTVNKGLYSVLLGDTTLMDPLPPSVFTNPDLRLRVWFDDGINGSQHLEPDQRIAAAGYALMAATAASAASVPDGAITSSKIATSAVGSSHLAPSSVTANHISTGAVTATRIAANAVISGKIAPGAVGTGQLADGAVTAPKIAGGAVGTSQLALGSVASDRIADGAVVTSKLAAGAVTSNEIAAGAVGNPMLADGAVTSSKISSGAVGSIHLTDGAITSAQIATGAVGTGQLADGAVSAPKIADGAVGTSKLAAGAVTSNQIATGAVGTLNLANEAVTAVKLAGGAVESSHLAPDLTLQGTVTADVFNGDGSGLTNLNATQISTGTLSNFRTTGTASNTANALVLRDENGGFSAGSITASSTSASGRGVYGLASSLSGTNYGVYGVTQSLDGYGGYFEGRGYFSGRLGVGTASPQAPLHVETLMVNDSFLNPAILGRTVNINAVTTVGVQGESTGALGRGVYGYATHPTGNTHGVYGETPSPVGTGVRGVVTATTGMNYGVYGQTASAAGYGGYFEGRGYFSQNLGVGTLPLDSYRLALPNTAAASGRGVANRWDTYSSGRWKENVRTLEEPLDKVLALRGVRYDWTEQEETSSDIGFIAEEVGRILPEIVTYEAGGEHATAMDYSRLTPLLVEALKEQQSQIAAQQSQIATLTARLENLENAAVD